MKSFKTASIEVVDQATYDSRVKAKATELLAVLSMAVDEPPTTDEGREAYTNAWKEAEKFVDDEDGVIPFELDDRVLKAYPPTPGQLTFMLAAMGRGQTQDGRFSAIMNIMMESMRESDQEYLESRLLTRDRTKQIDLKQIEEIFSYLVEEWFANPTQGS